MLRRTTPGTLPQLLPRMLPVLVPFVSSWVAPHPADDVVAGRVRGCMDALVSGLSYDAPAASLMSSATAAGWEM
jgi:hypothetical protein